MASMPNTRLFLSGELLVGVKRSDPNAIQMIKRGRPHILHSKQMQYQTARYLSEEPSTYLR
jgi:hypothetical protein